MPLDRLRLTEGALGSAFTYDASSPQLPDFHRHEELEVSLTVSGTGRYLVDQQSLDLRPNMQVWLFPGQEHLLIDRSSGFVMRIAVFRPKLIRRMCTGQTYLELRSDLPSRPFYRQLTRKAAREIDGLYQRCIAERDRLDLLHAGLGYLMLRAWDAQRGAHDVEALREVHPCVAQVARLLRDDPTPRSIDALGEWVGMSPSHLSRLFKREVGVTLSRYRQRLSLQRFLEDYRPDGSVTLLTAALRAGFGSYPQFHRVFKQAFGYGPGEYQSRIRDSAP